jgi:hypothetical protein
MRFASILFVFACGACVVESAEPEWTSASAPDTKADGSDRSDRDCQIVLRSLAQPFGLPAHSVDGVNWVVYEARVDVDETAIGTPTLLFSSKYTTNWWQLTGVPVDGGAPGYQRYSFTLDQKTVPMGDSSSWRSMRFEVIPLLSLADGGRLFDHNRFRGDFENYVITVHETRFGDDPAACH